MVEENSIARKNVVRLAVVDNDPIAVKFGHPVWAAWIKWRGLFLRNFLHFAEEFTRGRLIELRLHPCLTNRIQKTQRADSRPLRPYTPELQTKL